VAAPDGVNGGEPETRGARERPPRAGRAAHTV